MDYIFASCDGCIDRYKDRYYKILNQMSQITIINILQKIRSICKESDHLQIPQKVDPEHSINLQIYLRSLQSIRLEFIKYRSHEEQYSKLQNLLQKEETQLRKKIGVQHQLKLYTQALKTQVEDLEKQKLEFLENTKIHIKELKKINEQLYSELQQQAAIKKKSKQNTPKKPEKHKGGNKSLSQNKSKHDKSIRQIIKTQYIERDRSNSGRKKKKMPKKIATYETMPTNSKEHPENIIQNSKTFQVFHHDSTKKQKPLKTASKKKNNHLFSNFTLLNFIDNSHQKIKRRLKGLTDIKKSPSKQLSKRQINKSRIVNANKQILKQKKVNKSVYSVSSLQPSSVKKEIP